MANATRCESCMKNKGTMAKRELNNKKKFSLTEEICRLCDIHSLSDKDISNRYSIRDVILNFLEPFYPHCEIHIYGSTLNNFGTPDSDLDLLFVPYPEYKSKSVNKVRAKNTDMSCPSVNDVKNGVVSKEALLQMDVCKQLNFFRKVLKKNGYQQPVVIPARCPILHFYFKPFDIYCDLSYGSRLVLYNTKLLYFYNTIDFRVRLLVMTLRHWAKCLHFIQPGILSSYAVTLLVIFFLQNTDPPIVPSVKKLKSLSESSEFIENWEVAFTTDIHKIDISKNEKSPGELLKDFFMFYWKFDFVRNVVCPNLGSKLSIKELIETDDTEDFQIASMCIQDPFILSCNVSRNMKSEEFVSFKYSLFIASKILNNEKNSFKLFFDENEYMKLTNQIFSLQFPKEVVYFHYNLRYDCLPFQQQTNWKQMWFQNVCEALLDLLRYGLLFQCEVIDKTEHLCGNFGTGNKEMKEKYNLELLMSIQCAVYYRTFVGRSKIKEVPRVSCDSDQFSNETLRNEFVISNFIIQQNVLLSSPDPFFWFYCDCYAHTFDELVSIVVILTPFTQCKEIRNVFVFLTSYISKNITQMLSAEKNFAS